MSVYVIKRIAYTIKHIKNQLLTPYQLLTTHCYDISHHIKTVKIWRILAWSILATPAPNLRKLYHNSSSCQEIKIL